MQFPSKGRRFRAGLVAFVFLFIISISTLVRFYTDLLWYQEVGFDQVFWKTLAYRIMLVVAFGLLFLLIGLISFGILNLRRPVLQHWRWLPLATGLMGFIGFFLASGEEINATFLVFRTLFALGLMGLGLTLWLEQRTQEDAVAFA